MVSTSLRLLFAAAALLLAGSAFAAPLPAFTARYQLLQDGSPLGEATLTLAPGNDGAWTFTTRSKGTQGLAALMGADTQENSSFRWKGDVPEGLSYDYVMDAAIKHTERHVRFDWSAGTIDVDDKGQHEFPAQPGTMERHTVVLAIAAGLLAGEHSFDLPVAVRDHVETQRYLVQGRENITVPSGTYDTAHVVRRDGKGFEAWFASKLPVPVQVSQNDKNKLTMELESYTVQ